MTNENRRCAEPPSHLRGSLPSVDRLLQFLGGNLKTDAGLPLHRAAYRPENILPATIRRAHRFGPPELLVGADGRLPFAWLYAAHSVKTALWEAQFCKNDATRPGTYYLDASAVEYGVVAELRFSRDLRLWDLNGSASSRLGIFDEISSPDHEWCQWFGYLLHEAMESQDPAKRPDGFIYPSRRHRGHTAVAISLSALENLRSGVVYVQRPFVDTAEYAEALAGPLRVLPPVLCA
ncbi:hypothetical protein P3T24_006582 [Paraburkholderia sp. GAS33]|uniref:RES domain-containing protein n=1 Tax=Paraburkholderia sp. GAS33 TaxID=3035130 RepID=UPI003D1C47E2